MWESPFLHRCEAKMNKEYLQIDIIFATYQRVKILQTRLRWNWRQWKKKPIGLRVRSVVVESVFKPFPQISIIGECMASGVSVHTFSSSCRAVKLFKDLYTSYKTLAKKCEVLYHERVLHFSRKSKTVNKKQGGKKREELVKKEIEWCNIGCNCQPLASEIHPWAFLTPTIANQSPSAKVNVSSPAKNTEWMLHIKLKLYLDAI